MTENSDTPETGAVADAARGNWVDTLAPARLRPLLRLSRADRPIGTWLLLLPCWWGALLGALYIGQVTTTVLWVLLACALGAWFMRGAGCTWNDITDRDFDAQVARTRSRPIPAGQITTRGAIAWLIAQSLAGFAILLTFNTTAIALGIASLALVAIYPFAKRFTWWPQMFLGLAFNWGALLAWAAVVGEITAPAILLYLSGVTWTLFYDTIYAHQDKEDDAMIGVHSTARLFGDRTRIWLRGFMAATVALMGAAIVLAMSNDQNVLALVVALAAPWALGWHLAWQNRSLDIDDPDNCLALFRSNRNAGLLVVAFLGLALAL